MKPRSRSKSNVKQVLCVVPGPHDIYVGINAGRCGIESFRDTRSRCGTGTHTRQEIGHMRCVIPVRRFMAYGFVVHVKRLARPMARHN